MEEHRMAAATRSRNVLIGEMRLEGMLALPETPAGLIIFAHGSGSSRLSPRNNRVAESLQADGFATLLFDLLTDEEAGDRANVFDIPLLGHRVGEAIEWAKADPDTAHLPIGVFGASTGAAAALAAAAERPSRVAAVVSRGGRPDLAGPALPRVKSPTLLIVGGHDYQVIELNREARAQMRCPTELDIVAGATHLFEEPGTLEQVVELASGWFTAHCRAE
jgi:putative phosphoribosyl transferase